LAKKRAEYAVVPVQNKIVGDIDSSMSIIRTGGFHVFERLPLKVMHVLAGTTDTVIENVKTVRSHIEALKQCQGFLNTGRWTQVIGADTASSIRRIVNENDPMNAAIGSRRAAGIYGAKILCENIADDPDNWTTFCLVGVRV
jgi:prephenate dehydratase